MKITKKVLLKCRICFWGLSEITKAAPYETLILVVLLLLQGCTAGVSLFVIQGIVEWLANASTTPVETISNFHHPVFLIVLWGLGYIVDITFGPLISLLRINLNEKVLVHCNLILMRKANSFHGLEPFETPKIYNELQFLKDEAHRRPLNFVYAFTNFFREFISLCSIFMVLMTVSWWLPLFLIASTLPHAWSMIWLEKQSWDMALFQSTDARRLAWFSSLTLDDRAAKELRLFGFGDFIVNRYQKLASAFHQEANPRRQRQCFKSILLSLCTVVGGILALLWAIFYAKSSALGAASIVMLLQALIFIQRGLGSLMLDVAMLAQPICFFDKLRQFMFAETSYPGKSAAKQMHGEFKDTIIFDNVSFAYPDGRKVLHNINFVIRHQEKVAIVGENGAGKTTLVKLLARFYDPTEGRILIDGVDLKDLDIIAWRQQMSALFQDFFQFQLTVKENIAIANADYFDHACAIEEAARKGGFSAIAERLPQKYDTLLGKEFGGTQLSGGEWQKLAISRACMRNAGIFIFDEPTAALDPKSEHELFQKFAELSKNKTTIFITHRLGSVSMSDRVLVLKNGTIIEEGQHHELLQAQKEYATLFKMQANRYQAISIHS